MSGAERNKTMECAQAVVFSASSPSHLSGASHSLRAYLRCPAKTRKNNACCAGYQLVENRSKKEDLFKRGGGGGPSSTKIGRQKRVKEAMQSYLLVIFTDINSVPKIMV